MCQSINLRANENIFVLWNNGAINCDQVQVYNDINKFIEHQFDYLIHLKFDAPHSFSSKDIFEIMTEVEGCMHDSTNCIVLLTKRKVAPLYEISYDELIYSFGCSFALFSKIYNVLISENSFKSSFTFSFLDLFIKEKQVSKKLLVRQFPFSYKRNPLQHIPVSDVIIPHFGPSTYLEQVLLFLSSIGEINGFIGIDGPIRQPTLKILKQFPQYNFFSFSSKALGPYVVRNSLISLSQNKVFFFQDSDDIPCFDRFKIISNYMQETGCECCGSHEVRMDYFEKKIQAIRYPIDVKAALNFGPGHALLHPTSAFFKTAFQKCGGLSENRKYGNDTQFLLRSYFYLEKISNVDEFLYLRRRRSNSLTTSSRTCIGSPTRTRLLKQWNLDFEMIKKGEQIIPNSSLRYFKSKEIRSINMLNT